MFLQKAAYFYLQISSIRSLVANGTAELLTVGQHSFIFLGNSLKSGRPLPKRRWVCEVVHEVNYIDLKMKLF